ncbi:hypothetical protein C7G42_01640 [Bradyrhizobium sp. MOS003]|nr:hypothetical protein C7G42_01640 [Bradyrhizobium sp. MOS003]
MPVFIGVMMARPRHCEEHLRRSNPECVRGALDCFAALAMTETEARTTRHPAPALQRTAEEALRPGHESERRSSQSASDDYAAVAGGSASTE